MAATELTVERELGADLLADVLHEAALSRVDDADVYAERVRAETFQLEEGVVKTATHHVSQGAGVRAMAGERFGYAHASTLDASALVEAARTARAIASDGGGRNVPVALARAERDLYPVERSPLDGDVSARIELLDAIDRRARAADSRVRQVLASLVASDKEVVVGRLDGRVVVDRRPLVRLDVRVIMEKDGRLESGHKGGGGRFELERLLGSPDDGDDRPLWVRFVDEAIRQAGVALESVDCPAGVLPVVLGPGWPGVLLHEAVGHGLEGDFHRKGTSAFTGRIGERVASPLCTVIDDGTIASRRGSLNVDDEGTPTARNVLIEDGILRAVLTDRLNARLLGMEPSGNGRRQSYEHHPLPRMTNTFMLAGEDDPADIIKSVSNGLYAVTFGGGQVDITSGQFEFNASEAYRIEGGRITAPVRGATLIGNGPDVLQRVSRVGHDLAMDSGVGTCGKDGQGVPVGVGLPTILVDGITVGGTRTEAS